MDHAIAAALHNLGYTCVAWAETLGSYAELVCVPADKAVPVPDAVSDGQAAAALLQGMTVHALTHDTYPIRAGDDVLVHAAAGGVGLLLTQWATARGARVIGTVSTAEKAELARQAGAADVINYTEVDDLAAVVRDLTGAPGSPPPTTASAAPPSTPAWPACARWASSCCSGLRAVRYPRSTRCGSTTARSFSPGRDSTTTSSPSRRSAPAPQRCMPRSATVH